MASPASARAAHLHEEKNATGTRSGIPAAFFLPLNETADGMANDMLSAKDDKTILRVAALAGLGYGPGGLAGCDVAVLLKIGENPEDRRSFKTYVCDNVRL